MKSRAILQIALALLVLAAKYSYAQSPASSLSQEISIVDYCELISNPKLYAGKSVRVEATWQWGFEWSFLYNRKCMSRDNRAWVETLDEDQLCPIAKRNFKKLKDKGFNSKADVVAVGQLYDSGGYGHMNGYKYKFVISCLESAKQIPGNVP